MFIYLDTAIVIYAIEGVPAFRTRALARLLAAHHAGDDLVTSDLTRSECLVKPLRTADPQLRADYLTFLDQTLVVGHDAAIFDEMTAIRAANNYNIPDALHLATAVRNGCGVFLTNDNRLAGFGQIAVELLP
ncbi:MAG TPA: type II toxin-antitoxin system VapC family toxin [Pirellulales bacterium]|jgi:predicted nucleic acid-binding protein|nr:type II toxin-antitoxin system VapC family toxin [Pirellulales bacterium]